MISSVIEQLHRLVVMQYPLSGVLTITQCYTDRYVAVVLPSFTVCVRAMSYNVCMYITNILYGRLLSKAIHTVLRHIVTSAPASPTVNPVQGRLQTIYSAIVVVFLYRAGGMSSQLVWPNLTMKTMQLNAWMADFMNIEILFYLLYYNVIILKC